MCQLAQKAPSYIKTIFNLVKKKKKEKILTNLLNNKKFLLKFKFVFSLFQYYLPAIWMLISQLSEPSELDNTNL